MYICQTGIKGRLVCKVRATTYFVHGGNRHKEDKLRVERVKTRVVDQAVGTGRTRQVEWWQVVWWMITQKAGGGKNG